MNSPQLLVLIDMQDVFNTTQGTQDVLYSIASVDLSGFELVAATVFHNNPTSLFVKQLESNTTGTSPVVPLVEVDHEETST